MKIKVLNKVSDELKCGVKFKDRFEMVNTTLCAKSDEQRYFAPACIKRECSNCGVSKLKQATDPVIAADEEKSQACRKSLR